MSIGDNIKKRRLELHFTLDEVAQKLNTSKQTIQRYESGVIANIPSDKIEQMAKIFGVSPAYLMGWEQEQNTRVTQSKSAGISQVYLSLAKQFQDNKIDPEDIEKIMEIVIKNRRKSNEED